MYLPYLLLFFLFLFPLILIHELGHALAARAVGFKVWSISVGIGMQLCEVKAFGIKVSINLLPLCGVTLYAPPTQFVSRVRSGLVLIGGPATHAVFLLLYYFLFPIWPLALPKPFVHAIQVFMFTNIWLLVVNLFPSRVRTTNGLAFSDGYQLLRLPFADKKEYAKISNLIRRR